MNHHSAGQRTVYRAFLKLLPAAMLVFGPAACDQRGEDDAGRDHEHRIKNYKASHARVRGSADIDRESRMVTVVTADRAETLDPHNTESGGDVKVINQIYETLLRIDPTSADRLIPALARSWETSQDGRTIKFYLRAGVSFHDGAPLDAQAAKLSLDRLQGVYLDVPAAPYRGSFDFIAAVEADDLNLTIHLKRPVARIALRNLSMFPASIVSPRLLAVTESMDTGQRSTFISQWASGTGPYILSRIDWAEGRVRLNAFEEYWGGEPQIKAIVFRHVADPNSQIEYLKAGEADVLDDVPRPVWDRFEDDPNVHLYRWWALNLCYLGVNVKHEKTRDVNVRHAIRLAIDRGALKDLYYGTAREAYSLVARPLAEYDPDYRPPGTDAPLADRRRRASQLVDDAGAAGRSMRIYYPMDPRTYLPTPEKIADKLRQHLQEVGLDVEIVSVPNKELFDSVKNDNYELVLIGWMSDNADPDNFYIPLASGDPNAQTAAPTNCSRAFDPDIHQELIRAQAITGPHDRIAVYRAVERRLQEQIIGYVPLLNTQQGCAFGPRIEGVEVDPLGNYRFHAASLKAVP